MTFADLKAQASMLLTSENKLPRDDKIIKSSLKFAFVELADMATPLTWLTLINSGKIMRKGPGDYFIRFPEIPENDESELDIDEELVPAVAGMLASYLAKDIKVKQYHRMLAYKIMKRHDSKVRAYVGSQENEGAYSEVGNGDTTIDGSYVPEQ